jgi:hypothetical protein
MLYYYARTRQLSGILNINNELSIFDEFYDDVAKRCFPDLDQSLCSFICEMRHLVRSAHATSA